MRNWVKKFFGLYDIDDLIIGGHCGCCGKWIPNQIFEKIWSWGFCQECINFTQQGSKADQRIAGG